MKKKSILLLFLFIISYAASYSDSLQEIIENSEKPLNKNAGRLVELKEILRITDKKQEVFFTNPYDLQIDENHNIYVYDNFRLYKFDREGRFVFKIIERGQGPGEANGRTSCLIKKNEIIIHSHIPPKIMQFNSEGEYISEKRVQITDFFRFVGFFNNKIYGFLEEVPIEKQEEEGFIDFQTSLYEMSSDFKDIKKKCSFNVQHYVTGRAWWPRARLNFVLKDQKILFISHTDTYQIVKFNIEKNKVEKIFKRKYNRIKYPAQKRRKQMTATLSPPPYRYYSDIAKLLLYQGQLWVITSKRDKKGYRLVDVFDLEGKYIDNFYLAFPEKITPSNFGYNTILAKDEFLYTVDEDGSDFFSIAKYEIVDNK